MVTGRYLFVLALGAMALVVSLITQPIVLRAMGESVGAFDMISAAIGGLFLFALYTVFQIPGYYKYGAIKGRVFMYIPVAGFLATLFFLPKMPADNPFVTTVVSSPVLLIGLVLVLVVVMYAVSIWFSIRIILRYYDRYINKICTRTLYDKNGLPYIGVDEYMKHRLQAKLTEVIVVKK